MTEDQLEKLVTDYLAIALPDDVVTWHTPNGGYRLSVAMRAKIKRLGVVAGIPDRMFLYNGQLSFIEMKAPKGKISKAQTQMMMRLKLAGATGRVCRSLEEVKHALIAFGIPLKDVQT